MTSSSAMSSISESPEDENCNKAIDATKDYKLSDNNGSENVIPLEDSSLVRETSEDAGTSEEGSASSSSTAAPTSSKAKKNWLKGSKLASIVGSVGSSETAAKSKKMTLKSVAKRVNRQIKAMTLIKKWAQTTSHSQFATDSDHLNYMRNAAKDATIELPEPLIAGVRDEVLPILQVQYRVIP
ncbi:unnamed protein product [Clavelina lepadiformis]|uniref:TFIIS N-terminal domain-containing protein n=1 Tax=Clavelina lepadiformis TaxID=159417 RepID=A0ABP0FSY9_CLALP